MSRPIIRRMRNLAVACAAGAGVSGCVTDPAFLEGLALAADSIAASTANCYYRHNAYGVSEYYCPPTYGYGAPVYVAPVYTPRPRHYDRRDRHDRREWRDDRRRDRDRDGRRDRRDRRGGKG
ncbi:hypothetical protein IWC96_00810 [Brevundimonas sp. BAL450]|jgi:hypothetical protein|uniref:Lipoprotein n=1 Tax=Brevundimonas abyssalis TAR-001 TaxID=1391729 RepID=A0A8E0KHZ4_9CAUL|nr:MULTISPECIES: hypothetical protein [Brevundimonas]MBG7613820.1 hypothetical protein [Brevundimonas sp. BAL450]GAD58106.1 hypothetical protein MBEBAB_0356 [Brevundimonas abyssalis TAR-001]